MWNDGMGRSLPVGERGTERVREPAGGSGGVPFRCCLSSRQRSCGILIFTCILPTPGTAVVTTRASHSMVTVTVRGGDESPRAHTQEHPPTPSPPPANFVFFFFFAFLAGPPGWLPSHLFVVAFFLFFQEFFYKTSAVYIYTSDVLPVKKSFRLLLKIKFTIYPPRVFILFYFVVFCVFFCVRDA